MPLFWDMKIKASNCEFILEESSSQPCQPITGDTTFNLGPVFWDGLGTHSSCTASYVTTPAAVIHFNAEDFIVEVNGVKAPRAQGPQPGLLELAWTTKQPVASILFGSPDDRKATKGGSWLSSCRVPVQRRYLGG